MPIQDKEYLKSRFQTGSKPTEEDFEDLIDSYLHANDLDTDVDLTANSDSKIASQKAVKSYVDNNAGGGSVFSGAKIGKNSSQSVANNSLVAISFDSQEYDTDSYHNTGSNNTRLTIPSNGIFLVGGVMVFTSWTSGSHRLKLEIWKNGSLYEKIHEEFFTTGNNPTISFCCTYNLLATDYLELRVLQNTGGSQDCHSNTNLWITKM